MSLDQDSKRWFRNTAGGERQASTIAAKGTGKRVHHVIVDDANDTKDVSDIKLKAVWDAWRLTFQNRLKSMVTGGRCNIQQRTHMKDLSGMLIQEDGPAWRRVVIRQEFEPGDPEAHPKDPRTERNELFFPERFPPSAVETDRRLLQNGYSGQHQQRPVADGGDIIKPDKWVLVDAIPAGTVFVRGWDLAASDGRGDWTVGGKLGRCPDGRFIIADIARFQRGPEGVRKGVKDAAEMDGRDVTISLPQDPGQAGKAQALDFVQMLAGWDVRVSPESGDKVTRANPFAAQTNVGNVLLLRGEWNTCLISEAAAFPLGMHDDQIDALARAFNQLMTENFTPPAPEPEFNRGEW
jgi:predicted phage terminase large subunit-like protein